MLFGKVRPAPKSTSATDGVVVMNELSAPGHRRRRLKARYAQLDVTGPDGTKRHMLPLIIQTDSSKMRATLAKQMAKYGRFFPSDVELACAAHATLWRLT
jgi:hypothetical protein